MNVLQWLEKYNILSETTERIEKERGREYTRNILLWLAKCNVRVSRRASRSFGHAKYWKRAGEIVKTEIMINNSLLLHESVEQQLDTLLHEIAHVIDYFDRGKSGHDNQWKLLAIMVGANPKARGKSNQKYRHHNAKYIWQCQKCESKHYLYRKKKYPINAYYCGACGGKMKDITVEAKVSANVAE